MDNDAGGLKIGKSRKLSRGAPPRRLTGNGLKFENGFNSPFLVGEIETGFKPVMASSYYNWAA